MNVNGSRSRPQSQLSSVFVLLTAETHAEGGDRLLQVCTALIILRLRIKLFYILMLLIH